MSILNKTILFNSLWMTTEKIIYLFGLIFVTSFVAKYIGPENFGKLTFVTSIFAIIQTIAIFGLDNVVFHRISKNRELGKITLFASRNIRNILFFMLSPFVLVYLYFSYDTLIFIFSICTFIATFFSLNDVYSIYFNATLSSKINTICNSIGLVVSLGLRYLVPYFNLEYYWLGLSIIFLTFIPYVLKRFIYKRNNTVMFAMKSNMHRDYMFNVGRKLVLYSLSITLYTQVAQLFLGVYSKSDLGIFSVAYTLGNSFYFILSALISSFMTIIYAEKNMEKSQDLIVKLNLIVIIISFFAFGVLYFFGEFIIISLYGDQYRESIRILNLVTVSCCFSGLATISEKYLFKFKAYDYLNKKTLVLCVLNIVCSIIFIPLYGIYGAIVSILLLQIISATIYNYIFRFDNNIVGESHLEVLKLFVKAIK